MKISWFGHACFLIETEGIRIVTDPINQKVGYPVIPREADVVTVSHDHWDHNALEVFTAKPKILREQGHYELGNIKFSSLTSFHDKNQGKDRGNNLIFKITAEGINVVHLGDLGYIPGKALIESMGRVDVLLIPVGGNFTMNAEEAVETINLLQPSIVIPMHYGTPVLSFPLAPLEAFTFHYDVIIKKAYLELESKDLEGKQKIVVLDYLSC